MYIKFKGYLKNLKKICLKSLFAYYFIYFIHIAYRNNYLLLSLLFVCNLFYITYNYLKLNFTLSSLL